MGASASEHSAQREVTRKAAERNPLGERRGASGGNWFPPGRRGTKGMDIPQNVPAPWPPLLEVSPGERTDEGIGPYVGLPI